MIFPFPLARRSHRSFSSLPPWLPPFPASVPALVFFFVVCCGIFSHHAGFKQTSPFGFAALAPMVGMFSEQAVLKRKEISETLLSRPEKGKNDAEPQGGT